MKKTAELTTQQIVMLVVLITSFVIILFFIFKLGLGETTDKEICRNSVLLNSKSVLGGRLDCKTSDVCISGGEKCENFNEDFTRDINMNPKLTGTKTKDDLIKEQIMKAIADEMADCWWMFGEGKVDYSKGIDLKDVIGGKVCSLCSRIKFGNDIQEEISITSDEFGIFLRDSDKSKGVSYLYYLYKTNNLDGLPISSIETGRDYVIFTGISEEGAFKPIWNFFAGAADVVNKPLRFFFGFTKLVEGDGQYGAFPVILTEKEKINNAKCGEFLTKA